MSAADPFQPTSPTPVVGDDALADLEADFQETSSPSEIIIVEEEPPPVGRSWAFDFPRAVFKTANSKSPLKTHGDATLIQWAEKCLRTARGAHPIHPPGYGLASPADLIGQTVDGAPVAELEARIREALTFHPRIADIRDFDYDFDSSDEWIAVSFTMVLDNDASVAFGATLDVSTTREF